MAQTIVISNRVGANYSSNMRSTELWQGAGSTSYIDKALPEASTYFSNDQRVTLISLGTLPPELLNAQVISASFTIRVDSLLGSNNQLDLRIVEVPFSITQATWDERSTGVAWTSGGGYNNSDSLLVSTNGPTVAGSELSFTGTDLLLELRNWFNGTVQSIGLLITPNPMDVSSTTYNILNGAVDTNFAPYLTVTIETVTQEIIQKNSQTPSSTPSPGVLEIGELAVNTFDSKIFVKHSDNSIKSFIPFDPPFTPQVSFTSTTQASTVVTLADITSLSLALAANSVYWVEALVTFRSAVNTTGLNLGFTSPTGARCMVEVVVPVTSTAASSQLRTIFPNASTAVNTGNVLGTGVTAANSNHTARVSGIVRTSGTAGNFAIQFATEVAGSAITIQAGSYLSIRRIA